ncbi:hypothetical protein C1J03_16090 [Sulfitobacter sp. SK012]|uniref:hypothetical protein n=1 Tax=Sulfitobacter sp. SK012 TaxID=1389005 RepID=UPI000E0BFDAC|nr:hypothetical protein [Sulfitobacter sp. SK012]AXI47396.1 hypothetical protein C1J03_16090 [Sulfitobacter sp. SK012]
MRHPVIGLIDMQWDRDSGLVLTQQVPRHMIRSDLNMNSPFADLITGKCTEVHADLTDPKDVARYPIFADLAAQGVTGYIALCRNFGKSHELYSHFAGDFRGSSVSLATIRFSGFSDADNEGLARLVTPLCTCARVDNDRFLVSEILETYLGRISSKQLVLLDIAFGVALHVESVI